MNFIQFKKVKKYKTVYYLSYIRASTPRHLNLVITSLKLLSSPQQNNASPASFTMLICVLSRNKSSE